MNINRVNKQSMLLLSLLAIASAVWAQSNTPGSSTTENSCSIVSASGASLTAAKQQFEQACPGLTRKDCDPVSESRWMCSTDNITAGTTVPPTSTPEPSNPTPSAPVPNVPAPTVPEPTAPTSVEPPTTGSTSVTSIEHTYSKNDGPFKNPLKGWNSGWDGGNDHPESSVGFQYIPWKEFEPRDGKFDRNAVENIIDNEGSKNRHLILRLYCDWHGKDYESDCPAWMYTQAGVKRLKGDNGRYITDYNSPEYIAQAQDAIRALAAAYDDDPRIYAVQMGVIGYWGEWHTWGSDFGGDFYNITRNTEDAILTTYTTSFDNAKIMARYPWRDPTQSANGIGFHNDFFVANNGHSEEFDTAVTTGNQWTSNPIGGEVPPRGNGEANNEKNALFNGGAGRAIIEAGHYSTMKAGDYRVTAGDSNYESYMRLHKQMGYNYQIDLARFPQSLSRSNQLNAQVIGTNIGVAPMYFDWDVQFALLDANDNPVITENSSTNLTSILPGAMFTFSSDIALSTVASGDYRLAVRIIQPGADQAKGIDWKLDARNTYILFSNDLPVIEGRWNNNRLIGGWSVLGDVAVQ